MFEEERGKVGLKEAVEETFGITLKEKDNGQNGSVSVAGDDTAGAGREQDGSGSGGQRERNPQGEGPAEPARGTDGNGTSGTEGAVNNTPIQGSLFDDGKKTEEETMDDFYENVVNEDAVDSLGDDESLSLAEIAVVNPMLSDMKPKAAWEWFTGLLGKASDKAVAEMQKRYAGKKDLDRNEKKLFDAVNAELERRGEEKVSKDESDKASLSDENKAEIESQARELSYDTVMSYHNDGSLKSPELWKKKAEQLYKNAVSKYGADSEEAIRQKGALDGLLQALDEIAKERTVKSKTNTKKKASKPAAPKKGEAEPSSPSLFENPLVTDERYEELKKRLRSKISNLNVGFDPEVLSIGMEMAAYHIERGAKKFVDFSREMIKEFGDGIRGYLKSFYNGARDMPGMESLKSEMTPYAEVDATDVANIGKETIDPMRTADMAKREKEVEEGKKKTEELKKETLDDSEYSLSVRRVGNRYGIYRTKRGAVPVTDERPLVTATSYIELEQILENPYNQMQDMLDESKSAIARGIRVNAAEERKRNAENNAGTQKKTVSLPKTDVAKKAKEEMPKSEEHPVSELTGDSVRNQQQEKEEQSLVIDLMVELSNRMRHYLKGKIEPMTMRDVQDMANKYPTLREGLKTDLQELVERAMTSLQRAAAEEGVKASEAEARERFSQIVATYMVQPNLNARDSTRVALQQYSTPTPFAFLMSRFIQSGGKKVESMLEPSAGNGALTIGFDKNIVHVNDIDDRRLANLRTFGFKSVTSQNGLMPFDERVDAVSTNPPFGTVEAKEYDGYKITSLEGQMAINALESMKDDGRAAIIIGEHTKYTPFGALLGKDKSLFGYLYQHYNVVDVINMDGEMYGRNGTKYPVRMILIDGRRPQDGSEHYAPVRDKANAEVVTTFDELFNRVENDILSLVQKEGEPAGRSGGRAEADNENASAARDGGSNTRGTERREQPVSDGERTEGGTSRGLRTMEPRTSEPSDRGGHEQSGEYRETGRVDSVAQGSDDGAGTDGQRTTDQERRDSNKPGGGRLSDAGGNAVRNDSNRARLTKDGDLEEKLPYQSKSENYNLGSVMPAVQADAVRKSLDGIGDVDEFVRSELGYSSKEELFKSLAAEQIDSVAMAINQMNKGNAFIIGDMTGIGKGRQGAALIRYAIKKGKKPIFFTQKPGLFSDMYRDLQDIGCGSLNPMIIASDADKANIVEYNNGVAKVVHKLKSPEVRKKELQHIIDTGEMPEGYDYAVITYSQIQNGKVEYEMGDEGPKEKPKKKTSKADEGGQLRRDAISRLAQGNYIILDESHTAGGQGNGGMFLQTIIPNVEGCTFMSATFAKRPDNMPIYAIRTDISKADCNAQELIQAIMDGGVTLQEIMSKQLAESGQMIRRERDFSGVTIDWIEADEEVDKDQRKKFDEVANIFNSIKKFQDRYVKPKINEMSEAEAERQGNVDQKKGTKDMGVSNVPFASKMYNMVNQLLFSMKCDAVVDRVLSELEAGRKPVISFTNTMGTFIDDLAGIEMNEMPTLAISLEKALDGVLRITKKDAKGNEVHEMLSPSELGPGATEEYDKVRDTIRNLTAELPISPIDYIQQKIKEAGYSVGEITGRERRLGVTDAGKYKVMNLTKQESDGKGNAAKFNSGDLDVLMVNKAGSTGISLHASTKFKDQRQRVMIFAQFQSDINDEIQMRGRIDRTGQVCRGVYQYLMSSIPAERRLQMMFKAKLKSLDANTTSSQKSKFNEMEVVDYLNKYGDEVVWDYMSDHPELEEEFGDPLKMFDEKGIPLATSDKKEGCAATISRYLAFLSVSEQEQVFNDITEAYKIKIQQLDEAGENDLEIVTMPLNAETKSTKIWKSGRDNESGNAFASDTYLEEAEVDVLKKPMKLNEVKSAVSSLSSGKPFNEWVEAKISDMKAFMQDKAKTRYAAAIERSKKKAEAAKDSARKKLLKEREKGKADLSDAQIEEMVKSVYDKSVSDGETVCYEALHSMDDRFAEMRRMLSMFEPGKPLIIPRDVLDKDKDESAIHLDLGTFIGYKVGREFTPSSSAAVFATLDGRRRVEIPLSQAKSLEYIKTATLVQGSYVRDMNIEADWDRKVPTKTRKTAYIITGNLMQALVDLNKTMQRYQLISFTMKDGTVRQGALLPEEFDPSSLKERVPISKSESEIAVGKTIASADKEVMIRAAIRSYLGDFEVHVPKSKQKGGKYFTDPALLKLMKYEEFQTIGGEMVGHFNKENLRKVLNRLDKLGVTVLKESKLEESKPQNTKRYRKVTDKRKIDELEQGPTVKLYRAMQLIGGKLYPPMAAKVNGKFVEPSELGKWEEAEERPEQIKSKDGKNKFTLNKGNGSQIDAAYNPYLHLSRSPLNDQFTSASQRPNLVTVEVEVPESELYSNYRAEGAKDTTGEMTWHAGPVSSRLPEGKKRKVVLSRWAKPVRIVPDKEVARKIADMLEGENIPIPSNTVTPSLRKELEALGVPVRDTDKKYRFIGEKGAAAIDQAKERDNLMQGLRAAKQMEQAGKDAKAIKLATGWERGADGLWRYEQPDFKLKTDNLREYMNPYIEKKAALEKEMETYRAKRIAKFEEMERMRKEHPENESTIDKLQKEFKEFYQKEEAARLDLDDYGYTYRVRDWEGAMLSDIIDEPELFDAYPILSHLHISASKRIEVDGAYYSPSHNAIEVGDGTKGEKLLSALIHEVQHAIQVQEGFARGGSETVRIPLDKEDIQRIENERDAVIAEMEEDKKKGLEENALARWQLDNLNKQLEIGTKTAGREGYMRIAGEVEARNAERRMNMTDEERRNSLASETEDKPRESQIILLDDVADGDRKALLGNDGGAYTDPAYAEAYSENNVNQAIYSVAGKYMKRLYAGGVLGRVLTGNNATINTDKAKKEFKLVSEVLGDYRKALESMAARCTDAALREIQAVMDEIDRSIEYYKQLADGKDVWRTEEGSRYRLADALGGLSDVSRSSHLAMAQRAASVAERLHTPVRLVMSLDELSEEDRGAMGWYDTATGEVVIVVPNHTSVSEIEESVFHEAVGHKSMNELLGEEGFNEFLNDIYMNCDEETRKRIARKFVDGMTLREATEEAIAEIAEDMAHGRKPTTWEALKSCLKAAARKALRKLGFEANFEMNENDILYALWKNAKQMERGDVLSAAQSIAMQRGLDTDFTGRRFRKVPTGTDYGTASQRYEAALNARSYRFREGFQDSMLALKELQDAVVAETKTKLKEWEDAYTMENQLSSKDTADIEIYQRDFFNPMINVFKRFLKKTGMTQAEGTRYLFAKSGLERNREFAVRDAINRVKGTDDVHPDLDAFIEHYYQEKYSCETDLDIGKITFEEFCERMDEVAKDLIALTYYGHDGKPRKDSKGKEIDTDAAAQLALERDYSGLSDIFDPDEFRTGAIACVLDTESRGGEESRQLWDRINAATKETLRKSRDCGVTSVETSQKVSGMFAWYIPMRGFDADMASDVYDYFGKGQGGFNATVKDAKGRLSLADNPLATIGNMAESAILQGNKNMMKTGLLNLAFSHPTHLLKVQKAWIENVGTDAVPVWQYAYPDILPTDSAEDIADKLRDFEDEMKDKQEKGLAKHEYNRLDIPYIKTPDIVPEHLIRVKRNGREYVLILNGNPRAAQAVNGLLSSRGDESRAKKLIQQINRFMAGAFTTKNPTFIVRNLSRDLIFANSAVIAKEPLDYGNRFRKNQFTVMKKVGKLLYLYKHGRLDESDEWQRYFSEFIRNGGETGFTQLHSVEEYKQRMANALKQRNVFVNAGREAWTALFDCIEFGNRCAEDVSRFTTYATSRQMGRSIQRSVADAKEITVNFNKKGSGAKAGGVTGIAADAVRTLYLFSNAAIQGLVNVGRISKAHPFKAGAVVASFMAMGLAQPALNELLFSVLGGGDGDDDPYNNLPDFVRHSNLCFYVGNINGNSNFFTIPLSIELRAFFGLGEMLSQYGEGNISAGDAATEFATSLCELTPINFLGSGGVIDSATPDFAKPVEQILQNTDFTGKPIYRKSSFNTAYPEWTKAYSGTSKMLVKGCKALNGLSGGDNVKSGMIDVNPAMVEHLVTGYTGGLGQTFIDVAKIMQMGMVPDYRNPRNVPIAKAFIRQSDERTSYASTKAQYQKYMEWYKEEQHLRSGYKKEVKKGGEDALEYADKQRHLLDGVNMKKFQTMKAFDKQVSALYKEIGSTEDEEIIKRDNGLILELKRRCVERMKSLEGR
jgi:cell division protein FtsB